MPNINKLEERDNSSGKHRLRKPEEDKIVEIIRDKNAVLPGDSDDIAAKKEAALNAIDEFYKEYGNTANGVRRLCFEDVQTLLDMTGTTWLDLMSGISCDMEENPYLVVLKGNAKLVGDCLLKMDDSKFRRFSAIFNDFMTPYISDLYASVLPPIWKLYYFQQFRTRKLYSFSKVKDGNLMWNSRMHGKYPYGTIPISQTAFMADSFEAPLHWVMNLEKNQCLFMPDEARETLLDLFYFMTEEHKLALVKIADEICQEGK